MQAFDSAQTNDADRLALACEAVLFAAGEAVPPARLAEVASAVMGVVVSEADVEAAVSDLAARCESEGRGVRVVRWGEGARMVSADEAAPFLRAYFEEMTTRRLSRSLLETLAIVAYRQPITKPEMDNVRGVDSGYAVRKLLDLRLVDVVGRSDALGRPLLYGTTDAFLDHFGLADLADLPTLREVEALLADPAFSRERAQLLTLGAAQSPDDRESGETVES
jgi:segregation and condensation protein B